MNFSKQISENLIPNLIMQDFELESFLKNGGIKSFAGEFLQTWELDME